jgi:hypothetical protein
VYYGVVFEVKKEILVKASALIAGEAICRLGIAGLVGSGHKLWSVLARLHPVGLLTALIARAFAMVSTPRSRAPALDRVELIDADRVMRSFILFVSVDFQEMSKIENGPHKNDLAKVAENLPRR